MEVLLIVDDATRPVGRTVLLVSMAALSVTMLVRARRQGWW
jgi:hypothetical protein